jgi:membrane-bound lytic murein transglycosylase D
MAAYNAGPGKIRSAIRRSKTNDFWKISETNTIRSETKHYVPKVLAAIKLAHTETKTAGFALSLTRPSPAPLLTIPIEDPIDLRELAETSIVSHEMLAKWNPELLQGISPPPRDELGVYKLRVSQDVKSDVEAALPLLSKLEITDIKLHIIRAGDTLLKIAKMYKVTLNQIRQFNPSFKSNMLKVGKSLAIPIPGVVRRKSDDDKVASGVPEFG